ncbi:hypothetical protein BHM03_00000492 [Ensete ventricosum]|nr:hypothetical protein BHM03_00000492 [Ensete ventricosum]
MIFLVLGRSTELRDFLGIFEAVNPSPQVASHPSGNLRLVVTGRDHVGGRLSCAKEVDVVEVADIYRKMAAKRSESEGSSDDGGRRGRQQRRLRLRCDFMAASGIGCSKGATTIGGRWAAVCMAIAEEGSSGIEREMVAVVFNLLLAVIKIIGSERLLRAAM